MFKFRLLLLFRRLSLFLSVTLTRTLVSSSCAIEPVNAGGGRRTVTRVSVRMTCEGEGADADSESEGDGKRCEDGSSAGMAGSGDGDGSGR